MKVTDLSKQIYINNLKQMSQMTPANRADTVIKPKGDKIEFSKKIKQYIEIAKKEDTNSENRVNQIKMQINQGTYEVSSKQIANVISEQLILKK